MPHCQSLLNVLRQNGYRITPQREMIVEAIAHSDHHQSAEQVYAQIRLRTLTINLATVYRTLDLLVEQGLASRLDLGEGQVVYATRYHGAHIHLVCRQCGQVTDADPSLVASLAQNIHAQYHFTPALQHISILGLCSTCQDGKPD